MSDNFSVKIPVEIKTQMQMGAYLNRAVGYYIFARKAVMLGTLPVGGSMFHTAVEMLLHCGLSAKYTQVDLEKKFSKHELHDMWSEFKKLYTQTNLSRFDDFITHHRRWKELRYPKDSTRGYAIFFGRTKPDSEIMKKIKANTPRSSIYLEINLEEMDEFMSSVIETMGIDPDNIKISLQSNEESPDMEDFYLQENKHPLFDRSKVNSATFFKK